MMWTDAENKLHKRNWTICLEIQSEEALHIA